MNDLEKKARDHKKKSNGLGWYMAVSPDKGNQKALDRFNNATADGAIGEVAPMGEALEKDTVILYYENLPVEKISEVEPRTYDHPGATNYFRDTVEYEYEVDKNEVVERLADLITSEDYPEYDTSTDEEFWKFIEDNFDSLFDKYEKELLKEFSDYAREDWEEKHQESDWENRNDPYYYESLKESSQKRRYEYNGPVYYDGRKERDNFRMFTMAESPEKAISNILWRIAMGDKQRYYRYDLDNSKLILKELPDVAKEESDVDDEPHICDKCGIRLTDSGECPVCDYGEEDMFGESISPKEAIFRLKNLD